MTSVNLPIHAASQVELLTLQICAGLNFTKFLLLCETYISILVKEKFGEPLLTFCSRNRGYGRSRIEEFCWLLLHKLLANFAYFGWKSFMFHIWTSLCLEKFQENLPNFEKLTWIRRAFSQPDGSFLGTNFHQEKPCCDLKNVNLTYIATPLPMRFTYGQKPWSNRHENLQNYFVSDREGLRGFAPKLLVCFPIPSTTPPIWLWETKKIAWSAYLDL